MYSKLTKKGKIPIGGGETFMHSKKNSHKLAFRQTHPLLLSHHPRINAEAEAAYRKSEAFSGVLFATVMRQHETLD